ncbi:MAG: septal ring lytic transglycosylase RlpA family protein [Akkermansiaceae bacterium]|nr:septal ring lytic transglycosylase RlpA family protein [Akkermansiaceae bacterium]
MTYANIRTMKRRTILLLLLPALFASLLTDCRKKPEKPEPAPVAVPKGLKMKPYTVRGVRYRPMTIEQALQYTETGEASFYGQAGSRSASGEILRAGTCYAAHRTLPMPCTVRVTNIRNGKSCEVRVIDRGPFHKHRIIDLSREVGRRIGMNPYGTGQVKVEVISIGKGKDKIFRKEE